MPIARPPALSVRNISLRAATGSEKFLNAARHTMRSNEWSAKGIVEALPCRKSTLTDSLRGLSQGIDHACDSVVLCAHRTLYRAEEVADGRQYRTRGYARTADHLPIRAPVIPGLYWSAGRCVHRTKPDRATPGRDKPKTDARKDGF